MPEGHWRRSVFPALLALFALAYAWRITGVLPFQPVTDHLSNVYLTGGAVTLLSTPAGFTDPALRGRVLLAAAAFAAVNVVAEVVLAVGDAEDGINDAFGNVNTADPVDGLAGVGAALLVFLLRAHAERPAGVGPPEKS
ncbi:MAG TPA: hypothetical protein VNQ77_15600 [Frankiaceae bacterium]|nr:hypothetical protein [Frankiaceae bacterium]